MEKTNLTCIICPIGCSLEVTLDDNGQPVSVSGNRCPRGEQYAKKEILNPTRTLTSTVAVKNGSLKLVPGKTQAEIPKDMLLQAMEIIRRAECTAPVKRGDVLIYDILGTGVNFIACADVDAV